MSSPSHAQPAPQPPKFSRYRSVRMAAAAKNKHDAQASAPSGSEPPHPPMDPVAAKTHESIKRSRSRYRNPRVGASKIVTSAPPPLPHPASPVHAWNDRPVTHGNDTFPSKRTSNYGSAFEGKILDPESGHGQSEQRHDLALRDYSTKSASQSSTPHFPAGSIPESRYEQTTETQRPSNEEMQTQGGRNGSVPVSPVCQDYPRNMHRYTQDEISANARAAARHSDQPTAPKKPGKEKGGGGLLSRFKVLDTASGTRGRSGSREALKNMISSPQLVDPSETNKAPADDTPVSAVNASERTVLVICNESFISLPVTPATKVREILFSAADSLSEDIEPQTAILTEYFKNLGLERPLRKYEHVRDVINSWDNGSNNHLIVTPQADDNDLEADELLDARFAPRKQPPEKSFQLYHSQRPGKWEKRWVTLKPDGQVSMTKKVGAEATNICHMSDFDIYSLTRRESKRVKPPKKFCYAVKSQQKSSMFLTTENFVHYFSMNDKEAAQSWYTAMQQWRSWYLVNVLGDGNNNNNKREECSGTQAHAKGPHMGSGTADITRMKTTSVRGQHRFSADLTPYQPGPLAPLLDNDTGADPSSSAIPTTKSYNRKPSLRHLPSQHRASSPSKTPRPFSGDFTSTRPGPKNYNKPPALNPQETEEEPFAPTSLLGRTYTQRQNAMKERKQREQRDKELERDAPFIKTGLLGTRDSAPSSPTFQNPSQPRNDSSARATVISERESARHHRQPQKPLVDLTPTYVEPPQHARKGRGVPVEPGTLLVDKATGPDLAPGEIVVPSATTWRRPEASDTPHHQYYPNGTTGGARQRSATLRSQRRAPSQYQGGHTNADYINGGGGGGGGTLGSPTDNSPFAPTGLLARSSRANTAQGAMTTGRGVATGDRNVVGKPLLDMTEPSQFAQGSLLRAVEEGARAPAPVIDRERRDGY